MKILFITVRSDFGGGPRHVNQLVDHLPQNIELYMAYPKGGDPYGIMWDEEKRIKKTCHIPYRKISLKTLFQLKKFVSENDIDIVHSHGNGAGLYSRLLKLIGCKAKIIHTFHGITDNYNNKIKGWANLLSGRIFKPLTDCFILVSKGELQLGKLLGFLRSDDSHIIYNGIHAPDLHVNTKNNHNYFNIVTLSRFDYQKNMDMCFDIAKHFKDNNNIRFIWVGDGDDYHRLKQQSIDDKLNIIFTGFTTTPYKYLLSSDIYLSSSRFEGLPYALIEAASAGLPIVATNVVGNNECVIDGCTGFLYTTVEEAVSFINQLYEDRKKIIKMSGTSMDFFNKNFTIERMVNSIVDVYNKLLNKEP